MAKNEGSFNPEMVARQIIVEGAPIGKVSKIYLLEVLHALSGWVRSANLRAKAAEEKLREMPNWQSQYQDLQAVRRRLESENGQLKAENKALQERVDGYHAELDRWREESERQFDACNRQLNEKDDQIKLLVEQLNAAITVINCNSEVAVASIKVLNTKAIAVEAQLRLVALGVGIDFIDTSEAGEQGSPT